jgi:hypothetical protein
MGKQKDARTRPAGQLVRLLKIRLRDMSCHMRVLETVRFPTGGITRQIAQRFAVVYLLSNQEYTVPAN